MAGRGGYEQFEISPSRVTHCSFTRGTQTLTLTLTPSPYICLEGGRELGGGVVPPPVQNEPKQNAKLAIYQGY